MISEYSIACLLDNSSHEQLKICIPFLEKQNKPHISFFQFRCSDNFLSFWENQILRLKISSKFLTSGINLVDSNIFLDIQDDSTLQAASDNLAEAYFTQSLHKEHLSQISLEQLSLEEVCLVKKYGIHWIKDHFRPHVTLAYNNPVYNPLDSIIPVIPDWVIISEPSIYEIDNLGRIIY